jgi:hypothetical protein
MRSDNVWAKGDTFLCRIRACFCAPLFLAAFGNAFERCQSRLLEEPHSFGV